MRHMAREWQAFMVAVGLVSFYLLIPRAWSCVIKRLTLRVSYYVILLAPAPQQDILYELTMLAARYLVSIDTR